RNSGRCSATSCDRDIPTPFNLWVEISIWGDPVPPEGYLRPSLIKVPWFRNFPPDFELALLHMLRVQGFVSRVFLNLQGLNPRGSVEQVMKDVKSQASRNTAPGKQGGLNAEIQSRIGHQLRAMYDDIVRQGVPDRFAELIRKLDVPEAEPQTGNSNDQK